MRCDARDRDMEREMASDRRFVATSKAIPFHGWPRKETHRVTRREGIVPQAEEGSDLILRDVGVLRRSELGVGDLPSGGALCGPGTSSAEKLRGGGDRAGGQASGRGRGEGRGGADGGEEGDGGDLHLTTRNLLLSSTMVAVEA